MPDALLLIAAVGLPFVGAIVAGLLPTHARNAAAWLAGAAALVGLALVWAAYPTVAAGGVVRHDVANGCPRSGSTSPCGWTASPGCSRCW